MDTNVNTASLDTNINNINPVDNVNPSSLDLGPVSLDLSSTHVEFEFESMSPR